ncbi:Wee1-like protein kinase [Platanthera guangdongensis]|uniref:Wee1-like protein kinase n=1 Tax=Platanthera guangdongensis TaxID=2320717 RepID=A0ABR2N0L1_9ASPA
MRKRKTPACRGKGSSRRSTAADAPKRTKRSFPAGDLSRHLERIPRFPLQQLFVPPPASRFQRKLLEASDGFDDRLLLDEGGEDVAAERDCILSQDFFWWYFVVEEVIAVFFILSRENGKKGCPRGGEYPLCSGCIHDITCGICGGGESHGIKRCTPLAPLIKPAEPFCLPLFHPDSAFAPGSACALCWSSRPFSFQLLQALSPSLSSLILPLFLVSCRCLLCRECPAAGGHSCYRIPVFVAASARSPTPPQLHNHFSVFIFPPIGSEMRLVASMREVGLHFWREKNNEAVPGSGPLTCGSGVRVTGEAEDVGRHYSPCILPSTNIQFGDEDAKVKFDDFDPDDVSKCKSVRPGSEKKRYVSQSALALRSQVMPPPCIKNPYLTANSSIAVDVFGDRLAKNAVTLPLPPASTPSIDGVVDSTALFRHRLKTLMWEVPSTATLLSGTLQLPSDLLSKGRGA